MSEQKYCPCGSGLPIDRETVIVGRIDGCADCAPDWDSMSDARDPECLSKMRGPGYDADRFNHAA